MTSVIPRGGASDDIGCLLVVVWFYGRHGIGTGSSRTISNRHALLQVSAVDLRSAAWKSNTPCGFIVGVVYMSVVAWFVMGVVLW